VGSQYSLASARFQNLYTSHYAYRATLVPDTNISSRNIVKQTKNWRMASSWMLRRVALVRADDSEELSASFIRVTRIGELGTLAVITNRRTLRSTTARPLGTPRRKGIDTIKMALIEIGLGGVNWVGFSQDRYRWESSCECGNEPSGSIKCWETIEWLHNLWPLEWC
jgi:hypothetical protein